MYRARVTGARPDERRGVVCSVEIEASEDGESWAAVEGAPSEVDLPVSAVRQALREVEAQAALLELLRTTVRGLTVVAAVVAGEGIKALLPGGDFPVTVAL